MEGYFLNIQGYLLGKNIVQKDNNEEVHDKLDLSIICSQSDKL